MAASDFLFQIGANTADADAAVKEFVSRTNAALDSISKVSISARGGVARQQEMLELARQRLAVENQIRAAQGGGVGGTRVQPGATGGSAGRGGGLADISGVATRNAGAITKQKDALDFLNRIMGNTIFKFVEYELIMKAFNGAVGEVFNSLNEASNVQMEQVLQHIYNKTIDTNAALKDAIVIAKQWGSDITDVQQAIGLWTKQTSQMHDATGKLVDSQTALAAAAKLAADAEKFHRASGIDSLEVYTKSVSLWHELGLSLGQIPGLYDKIALAATKISPVLKAQPGTTSKQEGIKDIFEGVSESGATLRAQGMDDALIIATVAKQVENLGSTGAKVGNQISTMFGSLNQGGNQLREWVKILGPDSFKDSETFMDAAIAKVDQLKKAQADGLLHVKPQTMNTWRTFIETLTEVKDLADQIRSKSGGTLNLIAEAQMNTYNGQVERLKASFQQLNLALGTQLLPTATHFISFLSGTALPIIAANSHALVGMVQAGIMLGGAYLVMLGIGKVTTAFTAFRMEAASAALVAKQYGVAQLETVPGMEAATAQMRAEQAALAQLKEQLAVVEWQTGGYQAALTKLGVTEAEVAAITGQRMPGAFAAAGAAIKGFAARVMATMGPLIAIYGIMQLVSSGMAVFDQRGNMLNTLNENLLDKGTWQGRAESIPNLPGHIQAGISALFGRNKLGNQQFDNLAKQDPQLEKLYSEFKASHDTAHQDALREQIILRAGQDFDEKHLKNVPGYDKLDQIPKSLQDMMNGLKGGVPAGMTMPDAAAKKGGPKLATEQQIAAEQVNKDKADAMSEISKYRDIANAAASYIKTLTNVAKVNGYNENTVKALTAAYNAESDALNKGEKATRDEITRLLADQKMLEGKIAAHGGHLDPTGRVSGGDRTSALYSEAKAWRMANEAITKATGALDGYEAKKAKLAADHAALDEAQVWAGLGKAILDTGAPKTIASVKSNSFLSFLGYSIPNAANPTGSTLQDPALGALSSPDAFKSFIQSLSSNLSNAVGPIGKSQVATNQIATLKELGAVLKTLEDRFKTSNPAAAVFAGTLSRQLNDAGKAATKSLIEANKGIADFDSQLRDLNSELASKNAQDLNSLLGIDPGSQAAQKTLIDGYRSINDELTKANDLITQAGGSYANLNAQEKVMVQSYVKQIQLQQQLLPLLAQQQAIQESIAYKATEEALAKEGTAVLDQTISRLMGHDSNAATRKQQYDAAVSGSAMSSMQTLFKDYLSSVVTQWWQQTVKQFTNQMFGDPASKARQLEQQMLKQNVDARSALLQDEKTNVVGKLKTIVDEWSNAIDRIPGAGKSSSGDGLGTESNPMTVNTTGDGNQGLLSGPTSQANMGNAVAMGLESSVTLGAIADGIDSIKETSKAAGDTVTQAATTTPSSGSADASAPGGGGLIGAMLGPLGAAIPGLSKYLSTNGSWLNNIASGAAGGFAIGGMIGGAGSSNSDWGAIGGALGAAAGLIPGIGPVLAAALPTIGGILGGLFGHHDDPSKMPDKYDTQNYGQFVANINGAPGQFNGVTIGPMPQFNRAAGNLDMADQMLAWAKRNPTDPLAKQITALGSKISIVGEKDGVFTLADGKTISVTAYEALGQAWMAKAQNQANAPLISVNSYGGGSAAGAYNTPGMSSSSFIAMEQGWASGMPGGAGYGTGTGGGAPISGGSSSGGGGGTGSNAVGASIAATATPGYGGRSSPYTSGGSMVTAIALAVTTPVLLDGKTITQIVNAYNAQAVSNSGRSAPIAH